MKKIKQSSETTHGEEDLTPAREPLEAQIVALQKTIELQQLEDARKAHRILRLESRLDAVLYALVLTKNEVTRSVEKEFARQSPTETTRRLDQAAVTAGWRRVNWTADAGD